MCTVARFLGDHIPGHPSIVIQNQPEVDRTALGAHLQQGLERDGTVIALSTNLFLTTGRLCPTPS
jgi:hypothetical protein